MATIIKSDETIEASAGEAVRPAVYTLSDMATQGDDYVRSVRAQAAKAVQEANAEAARIRADAEKEGRRVAHAAISEMIDKRIGEQMQTIAPALADAITQIRESRGEWLDHWERATIQLAKSIAEKIVRREIAADPSIPRHWVREALEMAAGASEVTVSLHPDDHKKIAEHVGPLTESIARVAAPSFVADDAVSPGGCVVKTRHGTIDQRLETQLERIAEELS